MRVQIWTVVYRNMNHRGKNFPGPIFRLMSYNGLRFQLVEYRDKKHKTPARSVSQGNYILKEKGM